MLVKRVLVSQQDGQMGVYQSRQVEKKKSKKEYNDLGQDLLSDDLGVDRDELEWAYEQGALSTAEALMMISNHKRSVMR